MTTSIVLYLLTGSFAGFVAGLLGVGGGLIIVPVLYHIFSTQGIEHSQIMHMALATSLATIVITSVSSTLAHQKKRAVLWHTFFSMLPGILAGAWAGGIIAGILDGEILKPVFAIFELTVAIIMFSNIKTRQHRKSIKAGAAISGGFFIGILSAILGIGGGTITVPFLHWFNINIKNTIATSAAIGLPIALSATASYIYTGWGMQFNKIHTLGYVNLTAFFSIIITSFMFAPLGAKLAHALPGKLLKKIFAIFLLLLGIKMITE